MLGKLVKKTIPRALRGKQHTNPDHNRVMRRKFGISARQQRKMIKAHRRDGVTLTLNGVTP